MILKALTIMAISTELGSLAVQVNELIRHPFESLVRVCVNVPLGAGKNCWLKSGSSVHSAHSKRKIYYNRSAKWVLEPRISRPSSARARSRISFRAH